MQLEKENDKNFDLKTMHDNENGKKMKSIKPLKLLLVKIDESQE